MGPGFQWKPKVLDSLARENTKASSDKPAETPRPGGPIRPRVLAARCAGLYRDGRLGRPAGRRDRACACGGQASVRVLAPPVLHHRAGQGRGTKSSFLSATRGSATITATPSMAYGHTGRCRHGWGDNGGDKRVRNRLAVTCCFPSLKPCRKPVFEGCRVSRWQPHLP